MDGWLHDLRFALASLRFSRWTALVAIVTIGLGTGVNTAVLAVAYGVLVRPLPYADPSRLVIVSNSSGTDLAVRLDRVADWQSRLRTTTSVAAYAASQFTLRGTGEPRLVRGALVTGSFFDVLGVGALAGEGFRSDTATTVAISERLARQLVTPSGAGGDPRQALGRAVSLGQVSYVVGAIMPKAFAFPAEDCDVWVPARSVAGVRLFSTNDIRTFTMVARLSPGVTVPQASDDARRVDGEIEPTRARNAATGQAAVRTLADRVSGPVRPVLQAFVGAAVLVLLVACANVATLLVGRFVSREREFAIRLAIGASRGRLLRTALAESLLLAVGGWLVGLAIASALLRLLVSVAGGIVPRLAEIALDPPVLASTVVVALAVALLSGMGPALAAARTNFAPAFRQAGGVAGTRASRRLRAGLVTAQIALSIVLLTGAGLLARTVVRLMTEDAGVQPDRALTMKLMLAESTGFDAASRGPFIHELLSRVRALPGVQTAGVGSSLPPSVAQLQFTVRLVSGTGPDSRDQVFLFNLGSVTPGYFEAVGARLVRGRLFEDADLVRDSPIIVVSETAAKQLSPNADLVGRDLSFGLPRPGGGPRVRPRVVGIVGDIKFRGLESPAGGGLYLQWKDLPAGVSYLVMRTTAGAPGVGAAVQRVVREMDAGMPIAQLRTLGEEMSQSIAERRLRVVPAAAFAVLALSVALVGLSGTLTRAVAERRRELAIRAAVGATPRQAMWLIVRDGAVVGGLGLCAGLAGAALAGRALARLLYGVSPYDPLTLASVTAVVGAMIVAASYLPARRAAAVEPLELLRE